MVKIIFSNSDHKPFPGWPEVRTLISLIFCGSRLLEETTLKYRTLLALISILFLQLFIIRGKGMFV